MIFNIDNKKIRVSNLLKHLDRFLRVFNYCVACTLNIDKYVLDSWGIITIDEYNKRI